MSVATSLLLIILVDVIGLVIGTGPGDCCPSLYKVTSDNTCKLREDDTHEVPVREDYTQLCQGRLERISYQDIFLTSYKDLVYNLTNVVPSGHFCYGHSLDTNEAIVLACDTCLRGQCVQTCCPPGQVYSLDTSWEPPRCGADHEVDNPPMVCVDADYDQLSDYKFSHNDKTFDLTRNPGYYGHFSCPSGEEEGVVYSMVSTSLYYQSYHLSEEGDLVASFPSVTHKYDKSKFCLIFEKVNSTGFDDKDLDVTFRFCLKEETQKEGKAFTFIFYPAAILVSALFLLLTLIAYVIDPDLHKPLFGKITLGFVFNNLIAYLCLAFVYLGANYRSILSLNSFSCVAVGYLTLYSFSAFMFWINAMAANIFFKFSSLMSMSGTENDKYKFTLYTIYAQGMPLLLCAVVALIEKFGSCDMTRPNMGVAQCFLGNPWGDQWASNNDTRGQWTAFFSSPEFIYFYSVIIALQAANILFFLLTVYYLVEHWRNSAGIIRSETKGNFMIVIKLFFIMGIPWLAEFFSHLVTHKHGPEDSFEFRLFIDLLNLFTGVLVFVVLVCKKKTVKRVASRVRGRGVHSSTYPSTSRFNSTYSNTTRTSVVRDRDSTREVVPKDLLLEKETLEMCLVHVNSMAD